MSRSFPMSAVSITQHKNRDRERLELRISCEKNNFFDGSPCDVFLPLFFLPSFFLLTLRTGLILSYQSLSALKKDPSHAPSKKKVMRRKTDCGGLESDDVGYIIASSPAPESTPDSFSALWLASCLHIRKANDS